MNVKHFICLKIMFIYTLSCALSLSYRNGFIMRSYMQRGTCMFLSHSKPTGIALCAMCTVATICRMLLSYRNGFIMRSYMQCGTCMFLSHLKPTGMALCVMCTVTTVCRMLFIFGMHIYLVGVVSCS